MSDFIQWKGRLVERPILKGDPRHPAWKPPLGEFRVDVSCQEWALRYRLITHIRGIQEPGKWLLTHAECEGTLVELKHPWRNGVCPLLQWAVQPECPLYPVRFDNLNYLDIAKVPKDGYFWKKFDLGMEKDPERAVEARRLADKLSLQHDIYSMTEIPIEQLRQCQSYSDWLDLRDAVWARNKVDVPFTERWYAARNAYYE